MIDRAELDRLEGEHRAALAELEDAHKRVTAAATAIDAFWNCNHIALVEVANGEVLEYDAR